MHRSPRLLAAALLAAVLPASFLACAKNPSSSKSMPDQAEVLELAKSYDFVNPTKPVPAANHLPNGTGVPHADAPTNFTIERAVPKASPPPEGKVILARVYSDKAYPYLGVAVGYNYVWADRHLPKLLKHWWKTYMVPELAGADPKRLKRGKDEYSHGLASEPRLVYESVLRGVDAFGACLDDPNCSSGHCGYGNVD